MWIVTLMVTAGSCSWPPRKCEDAACTGCSTTSIRCQGMTERDLPVFAALLPPYSQSFEYTASPDSGLDTKVGLGEVNFKHLTELKELIINKNILLEEPIVSPIRSSAQNIFDPLKKLRILRINIQWYFEHPLDDLFRPLVNLEELDLSQTKRLNITNLQRAMYGLSNSTRLKAIKLFNIQTFEHSTYSTFNLTMVS